VKFLVKLISAGHLSGVILLGALASAPAQSAWNYVISDAGGGNSLLTWGVTGDLATTAGSVLTVNESSLMASINAPGIFLAGFAANGAAQSIPTPDGSYFQLGGAQVYLPIVGYFVDNPTGGGDDSFGLLSTLLPLRGALGNEFSYHPGTQSALIPIAFSNFNPGTYQSQEIEFGTPLTVNLVVTAIPEPSNFSVGIATLLGLLLTVNKLKLG